jgi:hypothetical protein
VVTRSARPPRRRKPAPPPKRPTAIVSLQDAKYTARCNWLVYGGSGIGKTVLAGTAPNALLLTTEPEGAVSAKVRGSQAQELKVGSWEQWLEYLDWLERGKGHEDYEWLALDSLDQLEEHAWNSIMGSTKSRSVGGSFRAKSRNDYPLVWDAIGRQVDQLCRLPVNVLITAKVMRVDVEDEDEETVTLALPLVGSTKRGDLAMRVCGQMTLVGYYRRHLDSDSGKKVRRLHTEDSERWVAKDRHDTFGRHVTAPDIGKMQQAVQERLATPGPRNRTTRRTKRSI